MITDISVWSKLSFCSPTDVYSPPCTHRLTVSAPATGCGSRQSRGGWRYYRRGRPWQNFGALNKFAYFLFDQSDRSSLQLLFFFSKKPAENQTRSRPGGVRSVEGCASCPRRFPPRPCIPHPSLYLPVRANTHSIALLLDGHMTTKTHIRHKNRVLSVRKRNVNWNDGGATTDG